MVFIPLWQGNGSERRVWHWRIFQFSLAQFQPSFSLLPKKTSFGKSSFSSVPLYSIYSLLRNSVTPSILRDTVATFIDRSEKPHKWTLIHEFFIRKYTLGNHKMSQFFCNKMSGAYFLIKMQHELECFGLFGPKIT